MDISFNKEKSKVNPSTKKSLERVIITGKTRIKKIAFNTVIISTILVTLPSDCNSVIIPMVVAGEVESDVPANKMANPRLIYLNSLRIILFKPVQLVVDRPI